MPKRDDFYVRYLGCLGQYFLRALVCQTVQICRSGLNRPENKNKEKRKKDIKQREKQKFLALGDLVRSSKKVFIEGNSLFLNR